MNDIYEEQLSWAKQRGLYIDPRIERKCVNGVWGLFATDDIPANTKLISFPVSKCIKNFKDDLYPENTSVAIKNIHSAVVEYAKGKDSDYYGHFLLFEPLEVLKEISTYFFSEDEMNLLQSMSPSLANVVRQLRALVSSRLSVIQSLEPNIEKDLILEVLLNYASRAWDDTNFLPIMDCANHSDRLGMQRTTEKDQHLLKAKLARKKGDEIFMSYGRKDMFVHAISYNYFDPDAVHYIQFGVRFVQTAKSKRELEILKYTSTLFPLKVTQYPNYVEYTCKDPDVCFLESGPSLRLVEYIQSNFFPSDLEWNAKSCLVKSLQMRLSSVIDFMLSVNLVDKHDLDSLPSKLHRFHHMLTKEQAMLEANKKWITDNFYL
jgi:hypothetical protein